HAERAQEFLHELEPKRPDRMHGLRHAISEIRTATEIDDDSRQRLVHGKVRVAVAADPALFTQRPGECLTEYDARVLDGVMKIDLDIPVRLHFEIHQAVPRKERQHMVEERDLRRNGACAPPVDVQVETDAGFGGVTLDLSATWRHSRGLTHW